MESSKKATQDLISLLNNEVDKAWERRTPEDARAYEFKRIITRSLFTQEDGLKLYREYRETITPSFFEHLLLFRVKIHLPPSNSLFRKWFQGFLPKKMIEMQSHFIPSASNHRGYKEAFEWECKTYRVLNKWFNRGYVNPDISDRNLARMAIKCKCIPMIGYLYEHGDEKYPWEWPLLSVSPGYYDIIQTEVCEFLADDLIEKTTRGGKFIPSLPFVDTFLEHFKNHMPREPKGAEAETIKEIINTHYSPIIEEILEEEQITDRVKEKPTFGGEIRYKKTRAKTPNPKTRGSGYRRQIKEDLQGYDD
jgi:hypothetical protein